MKASRIITETLRGLVEWVITPMPGPLGYALRWAYYKLILADLGYGTLIDVGVRIDNPRQVSVGRHAWIDRNVIIIGGVPDPFKGRAGEWIRRDPSIEGQVTIGDDTHIAPNVVINGMAGVKIGSKLTLAAGSKVYSLSHHYRHPDGSWAAFGSRAPHGEQYLIAGPVHIADNSGVGLNAVVLPGSILSRESFLAAQGLLVGTTEPKTLYGGVPAGPLKSS